MSFAEEGIPLMVQKSEQQQKQNADIADIRLQNNPSRNSLIDPLHYNLFFLPG